MPVILAFPFLPDNTILKRLFTHQKLLSVLELTTLEWQFTVLKMMGTKYNIIGFYCN